MSVINDIISFTTDSSDAGRFDVNLNGDYSVQIMNENGIYLKYNDDGSFGITTDNADGNTWVWLMDKGVQKDKDFITFTADRVSVSDIKDGQKVIVYQRIWNEEKLRYDMYAVDHDGTLYPCYAQGGKIMWLGDGTGSLEWEYSRDH